MGITIIDFRLGKRIYKMGLQEFFSLIERHPKLNYVFDGDTAVISK